MRGTLYFEVSEFGTLVFGPAHCVDEVLGVRALVPTSRTWGDARSALSPERYQELVDLLSAPAEPPESVWPLAVDELTHPEPWPSLSYELIADWLPGTVVSSYAQAFDSMMSSGVHPPAELESDIISSLNLTGMTCIPHSNFADLFSGAA